MRRRPRSRGTGRGSSGGGGRGQDTQSASNTRGSSRGGRGPSGAVRGRLGAPVMYTPATPATPNPHLAELDTLVSSFSILQPIPEAPLRTGFGTTGSPINLRANCFALRVPQQMQLFDYSVQISPYTSGLRTARIFQLLEVSLECAPYADFFAHDSSQRIVSIRQLPQPLNIQITYTGPDQINLAAEAPVFSVKVTFVKRLDLDEMVPHLTGKQRQFNTGPIVSAMNLILQKRAKDLVNQSSVVRVEQRKYFSLAQPSWSLSMGIEARRGYFVSVRPMYKQLVVNIDTCMETFYAPGNLADAILASLQYTQNAILPTHISRFLRRLKVETTHLGYRKRHTILRILNTNARQTSFHSAELGRAVTVEQYFQQKYNIQLQYADRLPLIDVGTSHTSNLLPPEVCFIFPGQIYRGRLPDDAVLSTSRSSTNVPTSNANSIVSDGLPLFGLKTNTATLDRFGVSVAPDMTVIPARILQPPAVKYAFGRSLDVQDALWNISGLKFCEGGNMSNWAVLLVQDGRRGEFSGIDDPELTSFLLTFINKCKSTGITISNDWPTIMATPRLPPHEHQDLGRRHALQTIHATLTSKLDRDNKPSFILVLLSGEDKFIYPGIKRLCDVVLGLQTVFMLLTPRKASSISPNALDQYFSNVCLKLNAKLGGINHLLREDAVMGWLKSKKTMLIGVGLTRLDEFSMPVRLTKGPAISAVVANTDDDFVHYPASLGLQFGRGGDEMVQELTKMISERLIAYQKKMEQLPERIIIFRIKVSKGQYDTVIQKEVPRILDACKKFNNEDQSSQYRPRVSIIHCGKHRHAMFSATATGPAARNGNTVPGTVVDKGVTDIYNHDFYLQAHKGTTAGIARPTHYCVLYDEISIPADILQGLTHDLSYLYIRATRGVSLVPPAYYADLACKRGKLYLSRLRFVDNDTHYEADSQAVYDIVIEQWGNGVHEDLKDSMFYI